jgi:hypothetical protein
MNLNNLMVQRKIKFLIFKTHPIEFGLIFVIHIKSQSTRWAFVNGLDNFIGC